MTGLVAFGICVVIIVALLTILLVSKPSSLLLVCLFPILASEAITGESGLFSPNGSSDKSLLFKVLVGCFALLQVLLLASVLFGLYWLLAGGIAKLTTAENENIRPVLTASKIKWLMLLNSLLWLPSGFFTLLMLFNGYRFRHQIKLMPKTVVFFGYVLPLLANPFAWLFLAASRNYLTHYPAGDGYLSFFFRTAALLYSAYLVTSFIREMYFYVTVLRDPEIRMRSSYWWLSGTGLLHEFMFLYFLVGIFDSL